MGEIDVPVFSNVSRVLENDAVNLTCDEVLGASLAGGLDLEQVLAIAVLVFSWWHSTGVVKSYVMLRLLRNSVTDTICGTSQPLLPWCV